MDNPLKKVMTTKEASDVYGVSHSTIKQYCNGTTKQGVYYPPKFNKNECRKSAGMWLITVDALDKTFKKKNSTIGKFPIVQKCK